MSTEQTVSTVPAEEELQAYDFAGAPNPVKRFLLWRDSATRAQANGQRRRASRRFHRMVKVVLLWRRQTQHSPVFDGKPETDRSTR